MPGRSRSRRARARAARPDAFERAYAAGVVRADPEPAAGRAASGGTPRLRAVAARPFALHGLVLTMDGPPRDAFVTVEGKTIARVGQDRPSGVEVVETGGVILPGLIDLHGHPEFNVFAAWEPPQQFANRYRWRASPIYKKVVRAPWNGLKEAKLGTIALRYAEARALVGGTTAIQGATTERSHEESLVRNVDRRIFGTHRARAMVDLARGEQLTAILADIEAGEVDAFYLHLAEGRRGDPRSQREWDKLVAWEALRPQTVLIHGTALTAGQLGEARDAGAKLVWSPQSNLRLYGETTLAGEALRLEMPVGLGADWLPSGSQSLLAEIKVARRELHRQGYPITDRKLVEMVTIDAARIAGLDRHLGRIAESRPADLVVLERRFEDGFTNVVEADPSWVELVLIDGDLAYGREDWVTRLAAAGPLGAAEPVIAWAKSMRLDTSYAAGPRRKTHPLSDLRARLVGAYPQVGPIFA